MPLLVEGRDVLSRVTVFERFAGSKVIAFYVAARVRLIRCLGLQCSSDVGPGVLSIAEGEWESVCTGMCAEILFYVLTTAPNQGLRDKARIALQQYVVSSERRGADGAAVLLRLGIGGIDAVERVLSGLCRDEVDLTLLAGMPRESGYALWNKFVERAPLSEDKLAWVRIVVLADVLGLEEVPEFRAWMCAHAPEVIRCRQAGWPLYLRHLALSYPDVAQELGRNAMLSSPGVWERAAILNAVSPARNAEVDEWVAALLQDLKGEGDLRRVTIELALERGYGVQVDGLARRCAGTISTLGECSQRSLGRDGVHAVALLLGEVRMSDSEVKEAALGALSEVLAKVQLAKEIGPGEERGCAEADHEFLLEMALTWFSLSGS